MGKVLLSQQVTVDDLRDALTLCFDTYSGKSIKELQECEIRPLTTDIWFLKCCEILAAKIENAQEAEIHVTLDLFACKGYLTPTTAALSLEQYVSDPSDRMKMIYLLLMELIMGRLNHTSSMDRSLDLTSDSSSEDVILKNRVECLYRKLKGCEPPASSSPSEIVAEMLPEAKKVWFGPSGVASKLDELIYPRWKMAMDIDRCQSVVDSISREYRMRRVVMWNRLNVTANSFLWNCTDEDMFRSIANIMSSIILENQNSFQFNIYDSLCLTRKQLLNTILDAPVSAVSIPAPIKQVRIGKVPNRGGLPEGYSIRQIQADVERSNEALKNKDAPPQHRGGFAGRGGRGGMGEPSGGGGGQQYHDNNPPPRGRGGRGRAWGGHQQYQHSETVDYGGGDPSSMRGGYHHASSSSAGYYDNQPNYNYSQQGSSNNPNSRVVSYVDSMSPRGRGGYNSSNYNTYDNNASSKRGGNAYRGRGSFGGRKEDFQSWNWRPST